MVFPWIFSYYKPVTCIKNYSLQDYAYLAYSSMFQNHNSWNGLESWSMSEKNVSCGGGAKQHEEHKNIWEKRFTEKAVQLGEYNLECFRQT